MIARYFSPLVAARLTAHERTRGIEMSNPTELPDLDRLEALRAALQRISDTSFGWDGDCGVTSIADDALSADDEAASRAQPEGEAAQAELVELLKAIRPNYGDVGSRDIEVTAQRKRIDRAIELLSAPAATLSPLCGAQHAEIGKEAVEAAAKAIYELLPPCQGESAKDHPWQPGGNSAKQDEAREYARAALAAHKAGATDGENK